MKKIFLNFVLILNIFKLYSSYKFGKLSNYSSNNNVAYSTQKDLGQCSCNLSSFCDYNCPCDKSCTEEDINKFDEDERDRTKYIKERLSDYLCQNKLDKFNYNKNKAGISVKDHIFSLMCIHKDNSPDMGEFYIKEPKPNNAADDWIQEFFNERNKEVNYEENMALYKPDSNGNCIKSDISKYKNNKYSCIDNNNIVKSDNNFSSTSFGNNIIGIKSNASSNTSVSYYSNDKTKIINFNVSWNISENEGNIRPKGYTQGTPLKINVDNQNYDQYYLPIIDNNGYCINENEENNAISFQPLLFKKNMIYSCIINNNNITNTMIYQFLCGNKMKICPTPDDKCENTKNVTCPDFNSSNIEGNVNIQLKIYSYKKGKESSPYEIIANQKVYINENQSNGGSEKQILTLNIKYIDVSSSSYYNTKDGKITSLIPLSDEELNAITVNDK